MKRNPFEDLKNIPFLGEDFFREMASSGWPLPADFFGRWGERKYPPVNVVETTEELVITAALPGLRQADDVHLLIRGNVLVLEGEVPADPPGMATVKVHSREREASRFSRTVNLPVAVEARNARAVYQRGILEIRLPKLAGSYAQPVRVEFLK